MRRLTRSAIVCGLLAALKSTASNCFFCVSVSSFARFNHARAAVMFSTLPVNAALASFAAFNRFPFVSSPSTMCVCDAQSASDEAA